MWHGSMIQVQLIISQMSQTRSELINPFSLIYSLCVILIQVFRDVISYRELVVLWIMCIVFTIGHVISAIFIVSISLSSYCDLLFSRLVRVGPVIGPLQWFTWFYAPREWPLVLINNSISCYYYYIGQLNRGQITAGRFSDWRVSVRLLPV